MIEINTPHQIISGFPGVGKTTLASKYDFFIDSDSSKYPDKQKYVLDIIERRRNLYDFEYLLISSHQQVREELLDKGFLYTLYVPLPSLKDEYLKRYKDRGDSEEFIQLISDNWAKWTEPYDTEEVVYLTAGDTLESVITQKVTADGYQ